MQKKLLSLLMVTACSIIYAENPTSTVNEKKDQKVPIISDAEDAQNTKYYAELISTINALSEEIAKNKKEKDNVETKLHSYNQRKNYRKALYQESTNHSKAIDDCKNGSQDLTAKQSSKMKQEDNGIERAWFSGVTDPAQDSRSAQEYDRIDQLFLQKNGMDEKLWNEHKEYLEVYTTNVLPSLKQDLEKKELAINTVYVPAFVTCYSCKNNRDAYVKCLARQGVSEEAASESFVINFINSAYDEAFIQACKHNIPLMQEELIKSTANNKITKETVAKSKVAQERFKKSLNGESLDPKPESKPKNNQEPQASPKPLEQPVSKPNIVPDKK